MKILQVVHDFLPHHVAGAEIYTYNLSKELQQRGHDVLLVFTETRHERPQYEVTNGEYEGLPYREIVWNFAHKNFRETYLNPRMDEINAAVLDDFRPDVIHLQHFLFFGVGLIDLAKDRGIPVVFTLHEYCLTCPRWGLRMTEDLELCHDLVATKCATCIRHETVDADRAPSRHEVGHSPAQRLVPAGFLRMMRSAWYSRLNRLHDGPDLGKHARAIEVRWAEIRERLDRVDLFIAPSPFLGRKFIEFGIPVDRIIFSDYGFRFDGNAILESSPSAAKVRFGYLGTLAEHKGIRTLVHAVNRLDPARVELRIYGDPTYFPEFVREIDDEEKSPAIRFMGRFDNREVRKIMASLDVIVVPSIWFENSPLTIHEAFMSKVPVVTTDLGGMKDLVQHEVSGLLFKRGNVDDLVAKLQRFVDEPDLRSRLCGGIPPVKTIQQNAAEIDGYYEQLLERCGKGY